MRVSIAVALRLVVVGQTAVPANVFPFARGDLVAALGLETALASRGRDAVEEPRARAARHADARRLAQAAFADEVGVHALMRRRRLLARVRVLSRHAREAARVRLARRERVAALG